MPTLVRSLGAVLGRFFVKAGIALACLIVFVFFVLPSGRYVEHRQQLKDSRLELQQLEAENQTLEARVARLESDVEIERVARREYDLVRPGEEVYAVLPPGSDR